VKLLTPATVRPFELAGGDKVQGSFDLVPNQIINLPHSPYASCFSASYDRGWCDSYPHGLSPEWCRNRKIDAHNIDLCNAAVNAGKEPIFANGIDQDPVRQKYQGKAIGSFLRAVDAAAQNIPDRHPIVGQVHDAKQ